MNKELQTLDSLKIKPFNTQELASFYYATPVFYHCFCRVKTQLINDGCIAHRSGDPDRKGNSTWNSSALVIPGEAHKGSLRTEPLLATVPDSAFTQ